MVQSRWFSHTFLISPNHNHGGECNRRALNQHQYDKECSWRSTRAMTKTITLSEREAPFPHLFNVLQKHAETCDLGTQRSQGNWQKVAIEWLTVRRTHEWVRGPRCAHVNMQQAHVSEDTSTSDHSLNEDTNHCDGTDHPKQWRSSCLSMSGNLWTWDY